MGRSQRYLAKVVTRCGDTANSDLNWILNSTSYVDTEYGNVLFAPTDMGHSYLLARDTCSRSTPCGLIATRRWDRLLIYVGRGALGVIDSVNLPRSIFYDVKYIVPSEDEVETSNLSH